MKGERAAGGSIRHTTDGWWVGGGVGREAG